MRHTLVFGPQLFGVSQVEAQPHGGTVSRSSFPAECADDVGQSGKRIWGGEGRVTTRFRVDSIWDGTVGVAYGACWVTEVVGLHLGSCWVLVF